MPEFTYRGVDRLGKKQSGTITAQTEGEVRVQLRAMGVRPTSISKVGAFNLDFKTLTGQASFNVTLGQILNFTRQFQVLIGAGIPIIQGLELLSEQSSGSLKTIVLDIRDRVSKGSFLWESVAAYPKVFPRIYIALVRAGETSGSLDKMLRRLCRYLEDSDRIRKMVRSAMIYPVVVMGIGLTVTGALIVFVIPKFEEMLKASGKQLPLPTAVLINTSHFVTGHAFPISAGLGIGIYVIRLYLISDEGRAFLDRMVFLLPVFGELAQKAAIARFSRTLQILLSSGVNILDALDICKLTIDNVLLEREMSKIRAQVETGLTLGSVVSKISIFPKMPGQMITIGESTGNLDQMLEKVADMYESDVETLVGGLSKAIEPLVIVVLGTLVGGTLIAMYLPVFQMAGGGE